MVFTDQMGYRVEIEGYPKRIISLVPSITELLFDLGLKNEIVGATKYCILPKEEAADLPKVGGTKEFDFAAIAQLKPDLIIGSKEENYKEGVEKLKKQYPVWISSVGCIKDAIDMILSIGELIGKVTESGHLVEEITGGFESIKPAKKYKAAYLIWREPYLTVGGDTFINDMLKLSGFINIFANEKRYPKINLDELEKAELILLSTEPYPFSADIVESFKERFPGKKVLLIDGLVYSWYGSRMKYASSYIKGFLQSC